ncbi:MAG: DUF4430 domain-containing protein [Clostridia bacterium]|nr:DUF4430 domain-containing protein [Clostridia bacterium]
MNKNLSLAKRLSCLLLVVLFAATALMMTACVDQNETPATTTGATTTTTEVVTTTTLPYTELGKGETSFYFNVTDGEGNVTKYLIKTDEPQVGTALQNLNLIDGEQGDYGLYVKTVNGVTLDYNTDGMYWAFYVNGEYAMTGVDTTDVQSGATYEFKAEK